MNSESVWLTLEPAAAKNSVLTSHPVVSLIIDNVWDVLNRFSSDSLCNSQMLIINHGIYGNYLQQ